MQVCYTVHGKVQGVWYRAFVKEQADALGIQGYAKNLENGNVEIVAKGNPQALTTFKEQCRQGPPRAKVTQLTEKQTTPSLFTCFSIL